MRELFHQIEILKKLLNTSSLSEEMVHHMKLEIERWCRIIPSNKSFEEAYSCFIDIGRCGKKDLVRSKTSPEAILIKYQRRFLNHLDANSKYKIPDNVMISPKFRCALQMQIVINNQLDHMTSNEIILN